MKTRIMVALCFAISSAPAVGAAQQVDMSGVNSDFKECIEIWRTGGDCDAAQSIASSGGDS